MKYCATLRLKVLIKFILNEVKEKGEVKLYKTVYWISNQMEINLPELKPFLNTMHPFFCINWVEGLHCVFRSYPDTDTGNIRTTFRNYPDRITAHPDTLSSR
jgi:hypothetical protein